MKVVHGRHSRGIVFARAARFRPPCSRDTDRRSLDLLTPEGLVLPLVPHPGQSFILSLRRLIAYAPARLRRQAGGLPTCLLTSPRPVIRALPPSPRWGARAQRNFFLPSRVGTERCGLREGPRLFGDQSSGLGLLTLRPFCFLLPFPAVEAFGTWRARGVIPDRRLRPSVEPHCEAPTVRVGGRWVLDTPKPTTWETTSARPSGGSVEVSRTERGIARGWPSQRCQDEGVVGDTV